MPSFSQPSTRVHASFLAAMAEFQDEGRGGPGDESVISRDIRGWAPRWEDAGVFAEYVACARAQAREDSPRPEGHVPSTNLWWLDGGEYLGRLSIRHRLTRSLLEYGGHIGYDVRRSARRQGHATAMLAAALPVARLLGLGAVLITCDPDNVGSRRVIEANGGIFDGQRGAKLRFWIPEP